MRSLAIIPARSGSKGLPDKNIINLNDKPLMFYTIDAALKSHCFDEVMVSTDSEYYAEIARKCGASIPFLRSEAMASDIAGSWDVVREVLNNYKNIGEQFDYVALLQPTSPLRDYSDIIEIFKLLNNLHVNNAISVTEVDHPVQWCFRMPDGGSMNEMAESPYSYMRRQDLEKYYLENGAIYLVDAKKILDPDYNFYSDNCHGFVMPKNKSIDIDSQIDLLIASVLLKGISSV